MSGRYRYVLETHDGRHRGRYEGVTFASLDVAREALRSVMGWDAIVLGDWHCASGDETRYAARAYETQADADADDEGAYAPRVERVDVERLAHEAADWVDVDVDPNAASVLIGESINERGDLGDAIYERACELYAARCAEVRP